MNRHSKLLVPAHTVLRAMDFVATVYYADSKNTAGNRYNQTRTASRYHRMLNVLAGQRLQLDDEGALLFYKCKPSEDMIFLLNMKEAFDAYYSTSLVDTKIKMLHLLEEYEIALDILDFEMFFPADYKQKYQDGEVTWEDGQAECS